MIINMSNNTGHIIVIGASAGGLQALAEFLAQLPEKMDTPVFGVLHLSKDSIPEIILQHLQTMTRLTCRIPVNGESINNNYFYLAPVGHHMMVGKGIIYINKGPHENRWRPSIDVLFRSAAAHYDSYAIGIILTGLLDDGTSGMSAIKRCGGICIVQEPVEAQFPDMPNNVIHNVPVDYRVSISDMGYILADLFSKPRQPLSAIPPDVKLEADITARMNFGMENLQQIATHSVFTCPDCGGGLWAINNDDVHRYRCHTGHVYNEHVLLQKQQEALEESVWVSIRMLEERRNLFLTMGKHAYEAGKTALNTAYQEKADETNVHIQRLKTLLGIMDEDPEKLSPTDKKP
jgi:two-component system chemotaxis response regulator CheB